MTEETGAADGGAAEVLDDAPDQAAELEGKALRMGWTPKDQFKGDPAKWIEAGAFVERGEQLMPLLQANNRKLETANKKLASEMADMKATLKEFAEHHSKTEARAYERAMADLKSEAAAAAELGDAAAVTRIAGEIADLAGDAAKPKAATRRDEPTADPDFDEAFDGWLETNGWFNKDPVMRAAAVQIAQELAEGGLSKLDQLPKVAKRIREEFPHKFTNPRRTEAGAVEGVPARGSRPAGKTYSDLPAEAKAACDDFVKRGLLTREKYTADYFAA